MASPSSLVRKYCLTKAGWNPAYREALEEYVAAVNYPTTHTYGLAQYILLAEQDKLQSFVYSTLDKTFFYEVFQHCTWGKRHKTENKLTINICPLIETYLLVYGKASQLKLCPLKYLSETANYIAEEMLTVYSNNVMLHFNNPWQQVVNGLLDCKQWWSAWVQKREAEGVTPAMI